MTAKTIHMLLEYLPKQHNIADIQHYQLDMPDDFQDPDLAKFSITYSDLSIGWKIARRLAQLELPFPTFIAGQDLWLRNAYLYCLNKNLYKCETTQHARVLAANPRFSNTINGLLLCDSLTYKDIGGELSVPANVIAAYEKLFFNVIDRHMDHLFIKNVVYPNGRLVEMYENYLENEDLGNILRRVGFNSGKEDVLHFAGFRSGLIGNLATQNMPTKLEGIVMANGYLLAKNGWANQREHAAGLSSARNLIAAAKHGGQEQHTDNAFTKYGPALINEILTAKNQEASVRPLIADSLSFN